MSKHTPGPWSLSLVEDGGIRHLVPIDASGTSLLTVVHEGGHDGGETTPFGAVYTDEDARLIAAAPELLESLEWALQAMAARNPVWTEGENYGKARAAIAKATGAGE